MNIKEKLRKFLLESPLADRRRSRMRKRLTNQAPSLLCHNCVGGLLFHELGLQFRSPTVNLMMYPNDFVKFMKDLDAYLAGSFTFFHHWEYSCPCAWLKPVRGGDKIAVHFTHFLSEKEAVQKWNERSTRIDRNNLFVLICDWDDLTKEEIVSLSSLPVKGLVVFTTNDYDLPYTVKMSYREKEKIMRLTGLDGSRGYEHVFDFVKWFNEANGPDFDVTPYRKNKS